MTDDYLFLEERLVTLKTVAVALVLILLVGGAVFSAGYLCGVSA